MSPQFSCVTDFQSVTRHERSETKSEMIRSKTPHRWEHGWNTSEHEWEMEKTNGTRMEYEWNANGKQVHTNARTRVGNERTGMGNERTRMGNERTRMGNERTRMGNAGTRIGIKET